MSVKSFGIYDFVLRDNFVGAGERALGTNPTAADTDGDGIPDLVEILNGLDPTDESDASSDPDGDGLTNAEELAAGTDWSVADTDGDGLSDGIEVFTVYTNAVILAGASVSNYTAQTSPVAVDTDGDGLSDFMEATVLYTNAVLDAYYYFISNIITRTNPQYADTDGDELTDYAEVVIHHTNPTAVDTDGDTLQDAWEVAHSTFDPLDPSDGRVDTDGDGLTDAEEIALGTNPTNADTDGDGLTDGWEQAHGFNPLADNANTPETDDDANADPDSDGLTNLEESVVGTDPHSADTDGDGVSDMTETLQGTDPTDRVDKTPVRWVTVTGDGDEDEQVETSETVTIPSGEAAVALVFIHSEEYPTFTSVASQYDDMLYWNVSAGNGYPVLTRAVHVNEEEIAWEEGESEGFAAFGFSPVAAACGAVYFAGGVDLEISVTLRAINVGDGILPSSVIVGFFPILVTQANMPTPCDVETTTDAGTSYFRARIPTNGVAYITGQPAAPSLTARIRGLPEWIPVDWGGTLVSERGDKRTGGIDDRTLGPQGKYGEEEYNITGALNGEIIGGRVTLNAAVSDLAGFAYRFSIRGKNPRDAAAKAYIDSCVPQETVPYAWRIACHESKDGDRFYNQFNAQETGLKELPNWGSPHGWGIAQIDKGENGDSTAEVYDWHENVASMRAKLIYAIGRTDAFLGYYRSAYSNTSNWSEPPSTNINGYVILPKTWSILTIYNGVDGIPAQTTPYHSGKFHSPLQFIPSEGRWIFHTNSINPNYVKQVFEDSSLQEGNGVE